MHISMPPQPHTSSAGTADGRLSQADAAPAQVEQSQAMANPYAVALIGLADIYQLKAQYLRCQESDPTSPDHPTASLAAADIRFLTHCGVTIQGQPVAEYINARGNALGPSELEQLAEEIRKRAASIELEPAAASPSRGYAAPVQRGFV